MNADGADARWAHRGSKTRGRREAKNPDGESPEYRGSPSGFLVSRSRPLAAGPTASTGDLPELPVSYSLNPMNRVPPIGDT